MSSSEPSFSAIFPSPYKLTAECKLHDFCTNELGLLLTGDASQTVLVGNPLRSISLDEPNSSQKALTTDSSISVEINCSKRYISLAKAASLSVYDLQKGSILRELHEHLGKVNAVNWHRESPWLLASVGADCTLRLWDLRTHPAQITIRRSTKFYKCLEFSPDCNYIACAGEHVSIFNLSMGQNVVNMQSNSPAMAVRFNPTECLLATAGDDRIIRFWDVDTGECVTQSPVFDAQIGQICFDSEGKSLLVSTGKQIASIHWEPFELLSQLDYIKQVHFPSLLSSSSTSNVLVTNKIDERYTLLDMRTDGNHLKQLIVSEHSDPMKRATIYLASLPLKQFEKCSIHPPNFVNVLEPQFVQSAKKIKEEDPVIQFQPSNLQFSDNAFVVKEEVVSPVIPSTPGSLLDSLIIDQKDEEMKKSSLERKPSQKSPFSAGRQNSRHRISTKAKNDGIPKTGSDPRSQSFVSNNCRRQLRGNQTEGGNATTPTFKRPADSSRNSAKPSVLIRRGISLTDVTNCASSPSPSGPAQIHPNQSTDKDNTMPTSSIALAKGRSLSQFSSSTASSSSNASSNSTTSSSGSEGVAKKHAAESELRSLEEFMQVNPKIKSNVAKMKREASDVLSGLNSIHENKAEHIIREVSELENPHLFAKILQNFMRQPRAHTLAMVAMFLPRVETLLKHRNNSYPPLALDFLEMVISSYGDSIRHGLASRDFSIGVDVAAEQRFDRCNKCKNALLQIRLNSAFCVDRLDAELRRRFESLLTLIDNLICRPN